LLPVRSCLIDGEAAVYNESGLAVFDLIRGYRHDAAAVLCAFVLSTTRAERRRFANIRKLLELIRRSGATILGFQSSRTLPKLICEGEEVPGRRAAAKLLTRDEARRIAARTARGRYFLRCGGHTPLIPDFPRWESHSRAVSGDTRVVKIAQTALSDCDSLQARAS
jgi:hypothetical protein